MTSNNQMVSLGFAAEKVPAGTQICQIFTDDNERNDSLLKFLLSGLQSGEKAACFSEKVDVGIKLQVFHQIPGYFPVEGTEPRKMLMRRSRKEADGTQVDWQAID